MYAINRTAKFYPSEQTEVYHIFTEDSAFVYQLFLQTAEELRGKEFPPRKKRSTYKPKTRR